MGSTTPERPDWERQVIRPEDTGLVPPELFGLGPLPADLPGTTGSVARVKELEDAIRWVVTQPADDLCWMDVYTKLAALVGIPFDPKMLPRAKMLANCERFVDSLLIGCPYSTDALTRAVREHTEVAALLKAADRNGPVPAAVSAALHELGIYRKRELDARGEAFFNDRG